ncbi:hypothetical protein RJG79_04010 [Mycoplasmatota bacterium WC44]
MHIRRNKKRDTEFSKDTFIRSNKIDPEVKKIVDKKSKNGKIKGQLNNSSGQG